MTLGLLRGLLTLALFVAFIALWVWAWSKRRREDFESAALLPLEGDEAMTNRPTTYRSERT